MKNIVSEQEVTAEITKPLFETINVKNVDDLKRTPAILVSEGSVKVIPSKARCFCNSCQFETEVVFIEYENELPVVNREYFDCFKLRLVGHDRQARLESLPVLATSLYGVYPCGF